MTITIPQDEIIRQEISFTPENRSFLTTYHGELWSSLRQKEQNILTFLRLYSVMIALLAGIGTQITDVEVMAFIVMILSFWGMVVVLEANIWYLHNMHVIRNVQIILFGAIYPLILPKRYMLNNVARGRIYRVHFVALSIFIAWIFVTYNLSLNNRSFADISVLFYFLINYSTLMLGVYVLWKRRLTDLRDFRRVIRETPGPRPSPTLDKKDTYGKMLTLEKIIPLEHDYIIDENQSWFARFDGLFITIVSTLGQLAIIYYGYNPEANIRLISLLLCPLVIIGACLRRYQIGRDLNEVKSNFFDVINGNEDCAAECLTQKYNDGKGLQLTNSYRAIDKSIQIITLFSVGLFMILCIPLLVVSTLLAIAS